MRKPMFTLQFDTENAAFIEAPVTEIDRILRDVALKVADGREDGVVYDANGNRIGEWSFELVFEDEE